MGATSECDRLTRPGDPPENPSPESEQQRGAQIHRLGCASASTFAKTLLPMLLQATPTRSNGLAPFES